jgi:hypothetical protein
MWIGNADGVAIGELCGWCGPDTMRRIVACVNACAGIADPADLRKQRDELLAAINELVGVIEDGYLPLPNGTIMSEARAAIANAEPQPKE